MIYCFDYCLIKLKDEEDNLYPKKKKKSRHINKCVCCTQYVRNVNEMIKSREDSASSKSVRQTATSFWLKCS